MRRPPISTRTDTLLPDATLFRFDSAAARTVAASGFAGAAYRQQTMRALDTFLLTVLLVIAAKTSAWLLQWRSGNAGLVDAIWSWTLGGLAVVYALAGDAPLALRIDRKSTRLNSSH